MQNQKASISQGVSIPFSQVSAQGVNTTFVEARLQLDVTPHITSDGSVLMNIKATNNQPDPSNTGANGQPAIQKKEAETQVLVRDGDTTVIGGIYVRRGSTNEAGVPWLMKIPILGFFFKTNTVSESRQELLIFITPRIVAQNLARAGRDGERSPRRRSPMNPRCSFARRCSVCWSWPGAARTRPDWSSSPPGRPASPAPSTTTASTSRGDRSTSALRPGRWRHRADQHLLPSVFLGEQPGPRPADRERPDDRSRNRQQLHRRPGALHLPVLGRRTDLRAGGRQHPGGDQRRGDDPRQQHRDQPHPAQGGSEAPRPSPTPPARPCW